MTNKTKANEQIALENQEIVVEEMAEERFNASDCASTASSVSSAGSCVGTVGSISSVISCGEQQLK